MCVYILHNDLCWPGVEHHEAELLGGGAGEVDVEGLAGGDDAVEEGEPLLTRVAVTPAVVLGPWRHHFIHL